MFSYTPPVAAISAAELLRYVVHEHRCPLSRVTMHRPVIGVLVLLASAGCISRAGRVAVQQGAAARTADFVYEPTAGAEAVPLRVIQVDGGPLQASGRGRGIHGYVWYVAGTDSTAPHGHTVIHYGQAPPGMVEAGPAQPLAPGRYSVTIRAGRFEAMTEFRVTADGRVESID